MNISITGQTGFVGKFLTTYLKEKGGNIISLPRNFLNEDGKKKLFESDIIIHLAGKAHDLKKTSNPEEYFKVNTGLTKKIYDLFLESKAKTFIYVSSVKAAADTIDTILTEDTPPNPKTVYGISKLEAENYILSNLKDDKQVIILRPCLICGPGNTGNLKLLHQFASKNIPWPLGSFLNQRSILSIENLGFIIQEILNNSSIPSGIYNVADSTPISTIELFKLFAQMEGKNPWILPINKSIIKLISKLGDTLRLPLNTENLTKLTQSFVVSNQKILKAIDKPLPISTKESILNSFKS